MEKTILNGERARTWIAVGTLFTYLLTFLTSLFIPGLTVTALALAGLQQIVMLIIGYYFGSSAGSKSKELIIKNNKVSG